MGQNHSNDTKKHSSLGEWREYLLSQGHLLKQVASLKYAEFVEAVESLNTVCNSLSNSRGKYLVFSIIPGTDCTTILWKSRVRIECRKMTSGTDQCESTESTRTMTLRQFVQVYDSIMQQCHSIEERLNLEAGSWSTSPEDLREADDDRDSQDEGCSLRLSGAAEDRPRTQYESDHRNSRGRNEWLEISTIFATVEQVSLESIDDSDCCICMEKKSDIVLSCAHTYCQFCIEDWRKHHNTCPMCMGDIGTSKDVWAFPEKPNAEEMTTYLMSIADSKEKRPTRGHTQTQRLDEEWETLSFNGQ